MSSWPHLAVGLAFIWAIMASGSLVNFPMRTIAIRMPLNTSSVSNQSPSISKTPETVAPSPPFNCMPNCKCVPSSVLATTHSMPSSPKCQLAIIFSALGNFPSYNSAALCAWSSWPHWVTPNAFIWATMVSGSLVNFPMRTNAKDAPLTMSCVSNHSPCISKTPETIAPVPPFNSMLSCNCVPSAVLVTTHAIWSSPKTHEATIFSALGNLPSYKVVASESVWTSAPVVVTTSELSGSTTASGASVPLRVNVTGSVVVQKPTHLNLCSSVRK
mmetsp:Transcript_131/g.297  ORF Transcript_131/g.297 Transcript_131/m.297 type:complete len:272 (+) Transcript_131:600-1415(+)